MRKKVYIVQTNVVLCMYVAEQKDFNREPDRSGKLTVTEATQPHYITFLIGE